jgi:hypothetical protein
MVVEKIKRLRELERIVRDKSGFFAKSQNSCLVNASRIPKSSAYLCRMLMGARIRSKGNTLSSHLTGTDAGR